MAKTSAYLSFDGTDLHFDAVLSESVTHTATVTSHPVEDGPDVSDHIRDELDEIELEVFITNQPIKDVNNLYGVDENYIEAIDIEKKVPVIQGVELDIPKYRPFPVTPGALMQTIGNAIKDAFSDATVAQLHGKTETETLSGAASLLNWPTKFNAVTDTVAKLVEWKKAGVVGQVITPWKTFPSMVITRVSGVRTAAQGDGSMVTISLKEIRLVEAKLVTAPVPTEHRGKVAKAKGRQPASFEREPTSEKKKSMLKKGVS